jgi:adenosylmethionine-8-amino-7-oxononanoate aminotransferase
VATPEEIRRWDLDHVRHPFSQMREYAASGPVVEVVAEGHGLIDDRGRRLFDGTSPLWCNLLGHRVQLRRLGSALHAGLVEVLGG